jgi:hypothetical protein
MASANGRARWMRRPPFDGESAGRYGYAHPVRSRYKIGSMIRRSGQIRGRHRRPGRSAGSCAAITCHWASADHWDSPWPAAQPGA